MSNNLLYRLAISVMLVAALSGCGYIDYFFLPPPEDTAQELMEAGQDAMAEKDYGNAIEYFTKLKDRYPFSPHTPQAEIALADAYFLNGNYQDAANAYEEYESLHPRSEQIPYVLFQVGVSNFRQFSSIDRPQHNIQMALESFYRLRETHPGTKYAEEALAYIKKCRRILAEHEIYIADFYWKSERFGPAWQRYSYVATNFKDVSEVQGYAQQMSKLSYFEHQKERAEDQRIEKHGHWKQWFDWL